VLVSHRTQWSTSQGFVSVCPPTHQPTCDIPGSQGGDYEDHSFLGYRYSRVVSLKSQPISTKLQGSISQKAVIFSPIHIYKIKWIHYLPISFWDIAPCSLVEIDRCFRGEYCFHHRSDMTEALHTSETSVYFNETTRRYIPESCHLQPNTYTILSINNKDPLFTIVTHLSCPHYPSPFTVFQLKFSWVSLFLQGKCLYSNVT
jgi:hypothetical protein